MEFKAFEHKKAHNFKLAPINFITIVLTLKWNEMKNFVIEFSQLLILFAQYLMCGCRVWVPYSANFIAIEIYLQRSNLGKAIINMHVNFKQKFKWFEHVQFQSTEHNQQLIISVSTIFFLFILSFSTKAFCGFYLFSHLCFLNQIYERFLICFTIFTKPQAKATIEAAIFTSI